MLRYRVLSLECLTSNVLFYAGTRRHTTSVAEVVEEGITPLSTKHTSAADKSIFVRLIGSLMKMWSV